MSRDVLGLWSVACFAAAVIIGVTLSLADCGPPPPVADVVHVTIVDGKQIVDYAARLEVCRAVGREAGTYSSYAACSAEAGL